MTEQWRNLVRNKGKRPDGVQGDDVVRVRAPHEHRWSESCTAEMCNWNPEFHYQLLVRTPAEPDVLRDALLAAKATILRGNYESDRCCCGDTIESHNIGSGHSPVDAEQYAAHRTIELIDAALAATEPKEVM